MYRVINFVQSKLKCNCLCPVKMGKVTFTMSQTFLAFLATNGCACTFVTVWISADFVHLSCCSKVPIWKLNNMHFECTTIIIVFEVHAKLKWFEFSESNKTHWWFRDVFLCMELDSAWAWRLAFIFFLPNEIMFAVTHGLDVLITSVHFFVETERKILYSRFIKCFASCYQFVYRSKKCSIDLMEYWR